MPLTALMMVSLVVPVLFTVMTAAIMWPGAFARLNAAAIRTLPDAGPKAMREQAASNSSPGVMRFTGVVGVVIMIVIGITVVRTLSEEGVKDMGSQADPWMLWPIYAIGAAQVLCGLSLITWSRRIFERLVITFSENGAGLRRWMIVVLGVIGCLAGAVVLSTAFSLT